VYLITFIYKEFIFSSLLNFYAPVIHDQDRPDTLADAATDKLDGILNSTRAGGMLAMFNIPTGMIHRPPEQYASRTFDEKHCDELKKKMTISLTTPENVEVILLLAKDEQFPYDVADLTGEQLDEYIIQHKDPRFYAIVGNYHRLPRR
jgi:hypothetical protein